MTRTTADGRKTAPAFLALAAVGFIASAPAHAADPADPVAGAASDQRDDVVIEGERVRERENPKATQPLINTPRSVVLISEDVIKDTGSATFVDALRTVPGITFGAAEGGNPIGDRPFIRGYDTQGSTFLDGVRDVGAQSREVFAVEQIEVVRGSDSTTGGRGSAGGAINIISKLPRGRTFASAALSYGTDDYKRVTLDANYRVSELIAVRLNAVYHDQDVAGRDFLYNERWGVAPSITIGVDSPTQLTASFYHLETDELPDSGFPYRYIASASVNNAPTTGLVISEPAIGDFTTAGGAKSYINPDNFYGLVNRDFRKTKVDQAMLRAQHDFGGVTLRNTARYSRTEQSYIYTQPDDSQANAFGIPTGGRNVGTLPSGRFNDYTGGGRVWRRANSRYGTVESIINQLDLFGKFETGPLKHNFAVGGELSWDRAARGTFVSQGGAAINTGTNNATTGGRCGTAPGSAPYNCADLFNPNPLDPWVNLIGGVATPIVRSAPDTQTIQHGETKALYAFDSIEFGPAILNLGVRYDDFRSRVRLPVAAGIRPEVTRQDGVWNYQAGLVIKPTANISLYGSFATASTPPNSLMGEGQDGNALPTTGTLQAAADALAVENTKSYELGAKAQLFGGRLALSAAVFRTETDNARVTSDQNTIAFIGKRRVDGIELSINGQILPGWQVFGGYTYLDATVVDGGFTAFTLPAGGGVAARTVQQPSVNTGRRFPNTPEHAATLWTTVNVTPRFTIGGGAYYQGRVYGGYADNRYVNGTGAAAVVVPATVVVARSVPGYTRFDATASYRFTDKLELRVNVQNLTDERYFATAYSSHYAQIAPGRSAFATLTIKY
jgi:catecholate siderophore receptor